MSFNGKVALVTGSSRGIGRAIAVELARRGAVVAVNYVGNLEAAEKTVLAVQEAGSKALLLKTDVTDEEQVKTMVQQTLDAYGRIDILVNNAGITKDNLLPRLSSKDWDFVIDVNLKGAYNCAKAVVRPMLKARRGRIINISSVVGLTGNAGQANYAAAKAGILGLTKSLARELGSRSITVNAVAPGYITTDMTANLTEKNKTQMLQSIPLARLGQPEEVAAAVAFLASEEAGYITGQLLIVDGGMTMY